jgi:hypothetical protein
MATAEEKTYEFKQLEKFTLVTKAPGTEGKNSLLLWSSYRGNPRMTVFTGVPNDTGKGVINAAMNPETFLMFLNMLKDIALSPKEDKVKLECFTLTKNTDGSRGEKIHSSDLWFGKDSRGMVWISVLAEGRPKIKFDFKVSDFHKFYKSDGTALSEAEASSLQTLAVVDALRSVFLTHMGELRPPYEPKDGANKYQNRTASKPANSNAQFEDISF